MTLKRSLLDHNQIRLERLRKYYGQYFKIESFYQPESNKTMIYSCQYICAGWADRTRGIMSVYMLALLTRRRFMIDMDSPCPISRVLQPNLINWTLTTPMNTPGKNRTRLHFRRFGFEDTAEGRNLVLTISTKNFISIWEPYDDIVIATNEFYIHPIVFNPTVNSSWLLGSLPKWLATQRDLFPLMFELLFKPTDVVVQGVNRILHQPYKQLVCVHVRRGRNPSNPFDNRMPYRENITTVMLDFLDKRKDLSMSNDTLIYVTSDSDEAIQQVHAHFPNKSVTVPGPIIHVDMILLHRTAVNIMKACTGWVKVLTDFYMLGECDTMIRSRSGFSEWATLRRINVSSDVYVYNDTSGIVQVSKI